MPEPLNLPRGSVRALLTILVVVVAALCVFVPIAPGADDARSMFILVAGFVLRDYFHARKQQNEHDGPPLGDSYVREE